MANQDLTTLTNLATITTDDIIYVVDDPATAKNPRKATITALINVIQANTASTDLTDTTVIARSSNKLDFFAATTSAELKTVIFDETGSGALVFATSPTFVTPALGTPASGVATNLTGTSGITGLGVLTQDIDMDGKDIILDVAGNISFDNSIANITTLKNISNFPNFSLFRDQIIGDGSTAGTIRFRSKDDSSDNRIFGEIKTKVEDTTVAGNFVHGSLYIRVMDANIETTYISFNAAKSGQIEILKNLDISTKNIVTDTTTGTKLGTSNLQKLGIWNAIPIVQPAHIVDADGTLADITTKFNTLLAQHASIGLQIAS